MSALLPTCFATPVLPNCARVSRSVNVRRNISTRKCLRRAQRLDPVFPPLRTPPSSSTALIVVDHGSKRAAANDRIMQVAEAVRSKVDVPVYAAHMELASPSIAQSMKACVDDGASNVIVVPFFLSPGRHVTSDIPELTAEAASLYPNLTYDVRPPVGAHTGIIDLIVDQAGLH